MKRLFFVMVIAVGFLFGIYKLSNVSMQIDGKSLDAAIKIQEESGVTAFSPSEVRDFSQEVDRLENLIAYFHDATQHSKQVGIPQGESRGLNDWYMSKPGICTDVSRAAELFLANIGFTVRHVSIYSLKNGASALSVAFRYRNPSHAVTEVMTSRGWMLFDSNFGRVYIDNKGNPIAVSELRGFVLDGSLSAEHVHEIFHDPYFVVYGLYSRHGMFYPPYVPVPDVAWADFFQYRCCELVK